MARQGLLSERFDAALTYALHAHDTQKRKGTEIPYAAHLLAVASLILEAGGSEVEAIVGLLHDAVEDAGGATRLADIRATFGDEIADAVLECSAEDKTDDPGWALRKERYLVALGSCSTTALRVSLADKVHNARSILADYRTHGDRLWERFNAPAPDAVLWYYRMLIDAYKLRADLLDGVLLANLQRTIDELEDLMQIAAYEDENEDDKENEDFEPPEFTWNQPARCRNCGEGRVDPLSAAMNGELCQTTQAPHHWVNDETVWDEVGTDDEVR